MKQVITVTVDLQNCADSCDCGGGMWLFKKEQIVDLFEERLNLDIGECVLNVELYPEQE